MFLGCEGETAGGSFMLLPALEGFGQFLLTWDGEEDRESLGLDCILLAIPLHI